MRHFDRGRARFVIDPTALTAGLPYGQAVCAALGWYQPPGHALAAAVPPWRSRTPRGTRRTTWCQWTPGTGQRGKTCKQLPRPLRTSRTRSWSEPSGPWSRTGSRRGTRSTKSCPSWAGRFRSRTTCSRWHRRPSTSHRRTPCNRSGPLSRNGIPPGKSRTKSRSTQAGGSRRHTTCTPWQPRPSRSPRSTR